MGYGIMYFKGKSRTKMYSTNTSMKGSFSDDIERAAKIVQKKNAEAAVRSLYRDGFKEQLYVVEIIHVPARLYEVPKPAEKEGFVIFDPTNSRNRGGYYSAAKKPSKFSMYGFSVLEGATTFKTEKEAQKCLDAIIPMLDEDIEYYTKEEARNKGRGQTYIDIFTNFKDNLEIRKL